MPIGVRSDSELPNSFVAFCAFLSAARLRRAASAILLRASALMRRFLVGVDCTFAELFWSPRSFVGPLPFARASLHRNVVVFFSRPVPGF